MRSYFKVVGTRVFEIVEYISTGKIVQREIDENGVPFDIIVLEKGKES